jgi:tRNA threonylcarbamoyl adenosine modification protein YjeE
VSAEPTPVESSRQLVVETPDDMEALGAGIARRLFVGDLVLLNGELGAGKTTLTRGLGAELGVRGAVTSPTFVLARTHPRAVGPALVHVDAYRLGSALELDDLDIDFAGSIVVVEWGAGLLDGLTDDWLQVDIVRPRAAGPSTGSETEVTAVPEPRAVAEPTAVPELVEGSEPRTVTITGHGLRWQDLGWVGAVSD